MKSSQRLKMVVVCGVVLTAVSAMLPESSGQHTNGRSDDYSAGFCYALNGNQVVNRSTSPGGNCDAYTLCRPGSNCAQVVIGGNTRFEKTLDMVQVGTCQGGTTSATCSICDAVGTPPGRQCCAVSMF